MANEQNLIPNSKRTPEELREITRKGGIASGKARRKKANLKKALETVLNAQVPSEKLAQTLETMGFENTTEMAIMLSLTQQAVKGNVRAIELINKMTNNEKDKYDIAEQKERIKQLELQNEDKKMRLEDAKGGVADGKIIIVDDIPKSN